MMNAISTSMDIHKPQTTRSIMNKDKSIMQGLTKIIGLQSYKLKLVNS